MIWFFIGCTQFSSIDAAAAQPIILSPVHESTTSTTPTFQGQLPTDWVGGSIAISVKDQDKREVEYIVLDATEEFSFQSTSALHPNSTYCWNVQYFAESSTNHHSDSHCFHVRQARPQ